MSNTTAPKTVTFDGERYRTASLRAEIDAIAQAHEDNGWVRSLDSHLIESALLSLAARREFGRSAWVYNTRADSRTQDGSRREVEVTVGRGARNRDGSLDVSRMWAIIRRDEIAAAASALTATEA